MSIHATAIISKDVKLGEGCSIGPYCVLDGDIEIADNCRFDSHVVVYGQTKIGANNQFRAHSIIGANPPGKDNNGAVTQLIIGANNVFYEFVSIHRGTTAGGGVTTIGNNNLFLAHSHVAHDCKVGNDITIGNYSGIAGHVELKDYCNLSAQVAVHQFCKVGSYSFLSLGALLRQDLPPFILAQGDPARVVGLNLVGLQRRNFDVESKAKIKECYRLLYKSPRGHHTRLKSIKNLADSSGNEYVQLFYDFLLDSGRQFVSTARN